MDTAGQVKSPAERPSLAGREDVTQLATPEHLGLLAFERLNAPGWPQTRSARPWPKLVSALQACRKPRQS